MMSSRIHPKRMILMLWLIILALALAGCATIPPQPITGAAPTQAATEVPTETEPAEHPATIAEGTPVPDAPRTASAPLEQIPPSQVEIFYSGTPSMMGFADAAQATIYENTMEALPAVVSLCWPQANATYYRYSQAFAKDDMRFGKDQLISALGAPSFYLDTAMAKQPQRLKQAGQPLITTAENMNEPIRSFWEGQGRDVPTAQGGSTGTPVAVAATDPAETSLSLIVTDLHELRMDDGALLNALNERCLQLGRTVGLVAISSEFAGYIPDVGANNTTYAWGSPPSGTLDYMLDYGEYKMGISVDPEQREMESRPFYILVIGDQGAVNTYIEALAERLTREFAGNSTFKLRTAVYGSGYVPAGYAMGGNMRYIAGQGVTAIAEPSAPAGIHLIELKASQQARFVQWELDYKVHPSDPRGLTLTAEDFTFIAEAVSENGQTTILPNLSWSILSTSGDTITLSLTLDLPAGILPQGGYTLELLGSLNAPDTLPGSEWLSEFGYDADGTQLFDMEQNAAAFDGSRTLFLSRLVDTLGKANIGRLGVASLGSVTITLTVYA